MWKVKYFQSSLEFCNWINAHGHKYQYEQIFVNNVPFAIEYRELKKIDV